MERLEDCISFLLGKAYQHVNQAAKRRLAPYGVTPVQYALLNVLWERDEQSSSELGDRLQLDSATMTGIIDRLEQAGLVERRLHPEDRRVNLVQLTVRGRTLQASLDQELAELNNDYFGRFRPDDATRLRSMLAVLGNINVASTSAISNEQLYRNEEQQ
ncbi:MAG: MarR family transcriptional regulator [Chloroflexales bacterium]|nr:MarR family transcriptional regulator [Chloroflexales bacterium]